MEKLIETDPGLWPALFFCLVAAFAALIFQSKRAEDYRGRFLLEQGLDDLAGILKPEWLEHISMEALYAHFQFKILPFYEQKFRTKSYASAWRCAELGQHVQGMYMLSKRRRLFLAECLVSGLKYADKTHLRRIIAFADKTEEGELGQAIITYFLFRGEAGLADLIANPDRFGDIVAEGRERILAASN